MARGCPKLGQVPPPDRGRLGGGPAEDLEGHETSNRRAAQSRSSGATLAEKATSPMVEWPTGAARVEPIPPPSRGRSGGGPSPRPQPPPPPNLPLKGEGLFGSCPRSCPTSGAVPPPDRGRLGGGPAENLEGHETSNRRAAQSPFSGATLGEKARRPMVEWQAGAARVERSLPLSGGLRTGRRQNHASGVILGEKAMRPVAEWQVGVYPALNPLPNFPTYPAYPRPPKPVA